LLQPHNQSCDETIKNLNDKNVEDITVSNDILSENINKENKDEEDMTLSDECIELEPGNIFCGKTFNSYDEAVNSVRKLCDKTFTPFILKGTRGNFSSGGEELGRISFICTHGNERKSKATSQRPSQRVNYTACPNINKQRNVGEWKITTARLQHDGHLLGEDVYGTYKHVKKLSEEGETYAKELIKTSHLLLKNKFVPTFSLWIREATILIYETNLIFLACFETERV